MNKINKVGQELIQYKTELFKDYPKLVKDSLLLSIEKLVEAKILDLDTFYLVKDSETSCEALSEYLLTKKAYSKSEQEIFQELEILRKQLNDILSRHGILHEVKTESVVDKELVMVSKTFLIGEQFTMDYFGVSEQDVLSLIKRRGFLEKFAVLRLTKIFNDFMNELSFPEELFNCDISLVYFDEVENSNAIDIFFEITVPQLENQEVLDSICMTIKEIKNNAENFYNQKTLC